METLVNFLTRLKVSRDDISWTWGLVAAVVVGLAAMGGTLTDYGVPASWLPYVRLAALIVGIVSGYMKTSPLFGKSNMPVWILAMLLFTSTACAHARHVAVQLDATFAQAVFALDDAELKACQTGVMTPTQCAAANPKIKQALLDVKAVTQSLQATPKDVKVPAALPDLLTNLTELQTILGPLSQVPQAADVVNKGNAAISEAIKVLRLVAGGQS